MDLRSQLQRALEQQAASEFLDVALGALRACRASADAWSVARWALEQATARDDELRAGPLMMLAGAAAARAGLLADPAPEALDAQHAVAELEALQDRLDGGLDRARGLEAFGSLGAQVLVSTLPRYLDMQLRTDPDDTVFLWTSGAMALGQGA